MRMLRTEYRLKSQETKRTHRTMYLFHVNKCITRIEKVRISIFNSVPRDMGTEYFEVAEINILGMENPPSIWT